MESFNRDTRNNKLRKNMPDGKSHKHGEDYQYMLKHYESVMKAKAAIEKNIIDIENKEKEEGLTIDEFYTAVDWNKKSDMINQVEAMLMERLCH